MYKQSLTRRLAASSPPHTREAPLPAAIRAPMEARFGHDFGRVRVRPDAADVLAAGAAALTSGESIAFAPGRFRPHTPDGRSLLAHELAHVVQQRLAGTPGSSAAAESEAEQAERAIGMFGKPAPITVPVSAGSALAKPVAAEKLTLQASSESGGTPMERPLTIDEMIEIFPELAKNPGETIDRYTDLANRTFALFRINTVESRAFFLAQSFMEAAQFQFMVEGENVDPGLRYMEHEEDAPARQGDPFYSKPQLDYYRSRYKDNPNINPQPQNLPKGWSGPRNAENFAYIGRGPVQVTGKRNYENAANALQAWGEQYKKQGDPPGIDPALLPGKGATAGERLIEAADAIRNNPALAGDPDYAFLLSGGFFKMGWHGSETSAKQGNASSLDKIATGLGKNASAGQIYGASGLMHGKANVKWPSGSGEDLKKSEAEFRKGWGKDTDLIKGNFATKAKAYNDIHAALLRFLAARPDPAGAKKTGTSN